MSESTPPEAQQIIATFNAQERQRQLEREAQKKASGRPSRKEKQLTATKERRTMSPKEIEHLAGLWGCAVETGHGKHGKHLIAPDGRAVSLPDHPGDLARGTCRSILSFIHTHGLSPQ